MWLNGNPEVSLLLKNNWSDDNDRSGRLFSLWGKDVHRAAVCHAPWPISGGFVRRRTNEGNQSSSTQPDRFTTLGAMWASRGDRSCRSLDPSLLRLGLPGLDLRTAWEGAPIRSSPVVSAENQGKQRGIQGT